MSLTAACEGVSQFLYGRPLVKALAPPLFTVIGSILVGLYVFGITRWLPSGHGQHFDLWALIHTPTCWLVGLLVILMWLYGWGLERFERKVRKALVEANKRLSNADLREKTYAVLLPAMLEYYKKEIEAGRLIPMPEVMEILGLAEEDRK